MTLMSNGNEQCKGIGSHKDGDMFKTLLKLQARQKGLNHWMSVMPKLKQSLSDCEQTEFFNSCLLYMLKDGPMEAADIESLESLVVSEPQSSSENGRRDYGDYLSKAITDHKEDSVFYQRHSTVETVAREIITN